MINELMEGGVNVKYGMSLSCAYVQGDYHQSH